MMKLVLLSIVFCIMQIFSQSTYSSLEIDDQSTDYTIDITIYENADGSVDYEISNRTATQDDKIASYILTETSITESENTINFQTGDNVYFIPFDQEETAISCDYLSVEINCYCNLVENNLACDPEPVNNDDGGITVHCLNLGCTKCDAQKTFLTGLSTYDVPGVFINATDVTKL